MTTPTDWSTAFLTALGAPVNQTNINLVNSWQQAEGQWGATGQFNAGSMWNPLNIETDPIGGATRITDGKGNSTLAYSSMQAGIQATVAFINTWQPNIGAALTSANPTAFYAAVGPWDPGNPSYSSSIAHNSGGTVAQAPAGSNTTAATAPNTPSPQDNQNYTQYLSGILNSYGIDTTGSLAAWVTQQVQNNVTPDEFTLALQSRPEFQARFPGMAARTSNGYNAMSVADYLSYEDNAKQLARAAGLPAGFMTNQEVAALIGGDVSLSELSDRINKGYAAAMNAPPETQQLLHNYFGIDTGHLAAYYLDPNRALPLLENQTTAAQIGASGIESGVGDIGGNLAFKLALQGLSPTEARSGFAQVAPLAPLEVAQPGTTGVGPNATVTATNLGAAQFLGTAADTRAVQVAQETRTGPTKGGGGLATSAKGVSGAGSASTGAQQGGTQ